ncbi:MAG: AAA family ATPase [Candidatus Anstonellales archaeon]
METSYAPLSTLTLRAYAHKLRENESFWNAFLVFLGALGILSVAPFYPPYIIPILAIIAGGIAYKKPPLGVILSTFLALFSFSYQSTVFGWVFLLVLAFVLFEAWEYWGIIAALQILVFLPFAPFPISLLGGFIYLGMVLAALHFGSHRSVAIAAGSILLVLLLSSVWQVDNAAYFPIKKEIYLTNEDLQVSKPPLDMITIFSGFGIAVGNLFDFATALRLNAALSVVSTNLLRILFMDSGIAQLFIWAAVLYVVSFLPGRIKTKNIEILCSLTLLLVPLFYYPMCMAFGVEFRMEMVAYAVASVLLIAFAESMGFRFSKELEIIKKEQMKMYGKFGLQELTLSKGEKGLEDVGGYEEVKKELKEAIITPLQKAEVAYAYGLKPPKGILFFGPPGTGKTMLMRALAKEIDYPFFYVKSSEIMSKWYGESEKNITEIFDIARKHSPCILFFDEIDWIGKRRDARARGEGPEVLSVFLMELDGFRTEKPVIVIGATNVPNLLDPALLRPGRFDKIIYMPVPDMEGRKSIFKVHTKGLPLAQDVDFEKLAKMTERFTGADIANVVAEAKKLAASEAMEKNIIVPIRMEHFIEVIENTKPSVSLSLLEEHEKFKLDFERSMGKIKERERKEAEKKIKFADVANLEDVKNALREAVEMPLLHPELLEEFEVKPVSGILLFGPPGTGKTYIVKAAANEFNVPMLFLSGAELMERGPSQAVEVIKETFNRARENAPAVIFIDEIETVAPAREVVSPIMGQLLQEMDGIRKTKNVVVIGATNLPQMLDPALLRPGRFDKIIYVGPPNKEVREEIFRIHLGNFARMFDLEKLAEAAKDYSGADIASVCQEVKMALAKKKLEGKTPSMTNAEVIKIIQSRMPSISRDMLYVYKKFIEEYGERR